MLWAVLLEWLPVAALFLRRAAVEYYVFCHTAHSSQILGRRSALRDAVTLHRALRLPCCAVILPFFARGRQAAGTYQPGCFFHGDVSPMGDVTGALNAGICTVAWMDASSTTIANLLFSAVYISVAFSDADGSSCRRGACCSLLFHWLVVASVGGFSGYYGMGRYLLNVNRTLYFCRHFMTVARRAHPAGFPRTACVPPRRRLPLRGV